MDATTSWVDAFGQVHQFQPTAPAATEPVPVVEDLETYAARRRYEVETGGITVNGAVIKTDRESQNLINGARDLAKEDTDAFIVFKAAGGFVTVDSPTMGTIAIAVGRHVRDLFAKEKKAVDGIRAGTITTKAGVDAVIKVE